MCAWEGKESTVTDQSRSRIRWARVIAVCGAIVATLAFAVSPVLAGPAAYTGQDQAYYPENHCQGNGQVNCNIYDGKQYVFLNAGPSNAVLPDGTYFFAVMAPGSAASSNPNDGIEGNLSSGWSGSSTCAGNDSYTNRTFTVSGGNITYTGSHYFEQASGPYFDDIQLMPYCDTTNPGGEYELAICSLANGYPVDPSDCMYDNFMVGGSPTVALVSNLRIKAAGRVHTVRWHSALRVLGFNVFSGKTRLNAKPVTSTTHTYTFRTTHSLEKLRIVPLTLGGSLG
jgi:hypothetical protein